MKNIIVIALLIGVLNLNSMQRPDRREEYRRCEQLLQHCSHDLYNQLVYDTPHVHRKPNHLRRFRRYIRRHYYDFIKS